MGCLTRSGEPVSLITPTRIFSRVSSIPSGCKYHSDVLSSLVGLWPHMFTPIATALAAIMTQLFLGYRYVTVDRLSQTYPLNSPLVSIDSARARSFTGSLFLSLSPVVCWVSSPGFAQSSLKCMFIPCAQFQIAPVSLTLFPQTRRPPSVGQYHHWLAHSPGCMRCYHHRSGMEEKLRSSRYSRLSL